MNRRQIVVFGLAAAVAGPSYGSGFEDEIVATLRAQGYEQITVEVTLLGRIRITAIKQSNLREIVVNPRTGEVLRDLWLTPDGRVAAKAPVFDDDRSKGEDGQDRNESSGKGSDDDSSDDDSSGNSGSGNSGSGNSGSNDDESDGSDSDDDSDDDSDGDSGDDGSEESSGGGRD